MLTIPLETISMIKRLVTFIFQARALGDGDGGAPYRSVDCFDHLTTSPFPDCVTLDDLFTQAVHRFGPLNCFGTREVVKEEEKPQEDGKVFQEVSLLIIRNLEGFGGKL